MIMSDQTSAQFVPTKETFKADLLAVIPKINEFADTMKEYYVKYNDVEDATLDEWLQDPEIATLGQQVEDAGDRLERILEGDIEDAE